MDPWNYLPAHRTVCAGSGRGILQPAALGHFLNARQHGSHIFKNVFFRHRDHGLYHDHAGLLFVDMFDTIGTVIGCAAKADMLDEKGKLPEVRSILLSDAVGTTVGAVFGTSTVTTFVESSAGIAHGGRTGLTTIVTGFLFLLSLFLSPIFLAVPSFATAPALIIVGFMMMQQIVKIDMEELSEAIPAFITLIAMPFMYSISAGISLGIISYVGINLFIGKRERISPLMYVLTVLFVLKYMMLYS